MRSGNQTLCSGSVRMIIVLSMTVALGVLNYLFVIIGMIMTDYHHSYHGTARQNMEPQNHWKRKFIFQIFTFWFQLFIWSFIFDNPYLNSSPLVPHCFWYHFWFFLSFGCCKTQFDTFLPGTVFVASVSSSCDFQNDGLCFWDFMYVDIPFFEIEIPNGSSTSFEPW